MFYSLHVSIFSHKHTCYTTERCNTAVTFVQYFPRHSLFFSLVPLILFSTAIILTERKKLDVRALFSQCA